jgi:carboxymethylenebutenolidase
MVNFLATQLPGLGAGVAFYGSAPAVADVPKIKAPLLLHFAGLDVRVNAGWPAYEEALKAAHVQYQVYVYPGVQHGFNNDTTPRYDGKAAKLAWQRSMEFLNAHLRV